MESSQVDFSSLSSIAKELRNLGIATTTPGLKGEKRKAELIRRLFIHSASSKDQYEHEQELKRSQLVQQRQKAQSLRQITSRKQSGTATGSVTANRSSIKQDQTSRNSVPRHHVRAEEHSSVATHNRTFASTMGHPSSSQRAREIFKEHGNKTGDFHFRSDTFHEPVSREVKPATDTSEVMPQTTARRHSIEDLASRAQLGHEQTISFADEDIQHNRRHSVPNATRHRRRSLAPPEPVITSAFKVKSALRPFVCNVCDKSFRQEMHLVVHSKSHSAVMRNQAMKEERKRTMQSFAVPKPRPDNRKQGEMEKEGNSSAHKSKTSSVTRPVKSRNTNTSDESKVRSNVSRSDPFEIEMQARKTKDVAEQSTNQREMQKWPAESKKETKLKDDELDELLSELNNPDCELNRDPQCKELEDLLCKLNNNESQYSGDEDSGSDSGVSGLYSPKRMSQTISDDEVDVVEAEYMSMCASLAALEKDVKNMMSSKEKALQDRLFLRRDTDMQEIHWKLARVRREVERTNKFLSETVQPGEPWAIALVKGGTEEEQGSVSVPEYLALLDQHEAEVSKELEKAVKQIKLEEDQNPDYGVDAQAQRRKGIAYYQGEIEHLKGKLLRLGKPVRAVRSRKLGPPNGPQLPPRSHHQPQFGEAADTKKLSSGETGSSEATKAQRSLDHQQRHTFGAPRESGTMRSNKTDDGALARQSATGNGPRRAPPPQIHSSKDQLGIAKSIPPPKMHPSKNQLASVNKSVPPPQVDSSKDNIGITKTILPPQMHSPKNQIGIAKSIHPPQTHSSKNQIGIAKSIHPPQTLSSKNQIGIVKSVPAPPRIPNRANARRSSDPGVRLPPEPLRYRQSSHPRLGQPPVPSAADLLGKKALEVFLKRHDMDQAEALFLDALNENPEHPTNLGNYAHCLHIANRDLKRVEVLFKDALQLNPKHPINLAYFAEFLASKGDVERAEQYHERAIAAAPGNSNILGGYARFLVSVNKNPEFAKDLLARAIDINPRHPHNMAALAKLESEVFGFHRVAEKWWQRALAELPHNATLLTGFASFLSKKADATSSAEEKEELLRNARKHYVEAIRSNPSHKLAHERYALLLRDNPSLREGNSQVVIPGSPSKAIARRRELKAGASFLAFPRTRGTENETRMVPGSPKKRRKPKLTGWGNQWSG